MALGWAVLVGWLAQLLFQLPHLKKIGMLVLPRLNLRDTGVWRVMKHMVPAIIHLPRTTSAMLNADLQKVARHQLKPGDAVFFRTQGGTRSNHVLPVRGAWIKRLSPMYRPT